MAAHLGALIDDLAGCGLTVCSVVTDNAKNEIKTVRLVGEKYNVFRVPCLSHTANLVIGDFFDAQYPGHKVFEELRKLMNVLPHIKRDDQFYGCTSVCETRWFSLWDFFHFVVAREVDIREFLKQRCQTQAIIAAREVFERYDFAGILPYLTVMGSFIKWTEGEDSTLGTAWGLIRYVHQMLTARAAQPVLQGINFAPLFLRFFDSRFTTTADVPEMLLAYLMTSDGLQWYRSLRNETIGACEFTQESVKTAVEPLLRWFIEFATFNWEPFEETWNWYLKEASFRGKGNISFWERTRGGGGMFTPSGSTRRQIRFALGTLGLILAIMPVSESGVERIFSHLRDLLRPTRDRMEPELVEARLVVKLNNYPDMATSAARLAELDKPEGHLERVLPPLQLPPPGPPVIPRFAPGSRLRTVSIPSPDVGQ
jgi:hypothetical protein